MCFLMSKTNISKLILVAFNEKSSNKSYTQTLHFETEKHPSQDMSLIAINRQDLVNVWR